MSELTTAAKGCVIAATRNGPGYYRIHGLDSTGVVLVQSVLTDRRDIVAAMSCFANAHKFYVFGHALGNIVVNLEAFLGNEPDNTEEQINAFFDASRSSVALKPITVTSRGGASYSFFLTRMAVTGTNPDTNMITFQLVGTLIE